MVSAAAFVFMFAVGIPTVRPKCLPWTISPVMMQGIT
jgi:hypothetical protein